MAKVNQLNVGVNELRKKIKGRKTLKIALIIVGVLLCIITAAVISYVYNNLNYDKAHLQETMKAGFKEKQVTLKDGTVLNYGEGPDNGPALLLIHGQAVEWKDYASVLPQLSKYYHIYAVDCEGHGKSSKIPKKYTAEAIGTDLVWFIENVIGKPAVISGHSSGGLLTAWIAANVPKDVRGIVLEDPPLFSTEPDRCQKTFVWVDTFKNAHDFLNQNKEKDYIVYYLKHSYLKRMFGSFWDSITNYAIQYREKHPNEKLKIFFVSPSISRIWDCISPNYDLRFADTFYDCSWFKNFNQSETLSKIQCPSVLIHASKKINNSDGLYDDNGILLAAMDFKDAKCAHKLIKNNELIEVSSGHDVHYEKSDEFVNIMKEFREKIK